MVIGLGYPPIAKALSGPPIQYSTFSFLVTRENPIARCSFNYRYHKNKGQGALKYDPVSCTRIYDKASCIRLRELRGWGSLSFQFYLAISPKCQDFKRKVMVVPSVGCPKALGIEGIVKQLLWAEAAQTRPTVLLVHESEIEDYVKALKEILVIFGVGLVAWRCSSPVLGFGISRLAAQQCRYALPGSCLDVILCDVNVAAPSAYPKPTIKPKKLPSKTVDIGYLSDDDDYESWKNSVTFIYMGTGQGTGIPTLSWNSETSSIEKTKAARGGKGRPIEQVVVVGDDELLYDPCFITSSEDADMTASVELELSFISSESDSIVRKSDAYIDKIDIASRGNHSKKYMTLRDDYLRSLRHEDGIVIEYRKDEVDTNVTVGELANSIAKALKLDSLVIRSLIIEKILLEFKIKCLNVLDEEVVLTEEIKIQGEHKDGSGKDKDEDMDDTSD